MSADSGADKGMVRVMAMVGAALVVFTLFCVTMARVLGIGGYDEEDELMTNALIQRIEPVGQVRTDPLPEEEEGGEQVAAAQSPEELVQGACASCHAAGVAGAPALDDDAAWAERREAGLDNLVASVVNGKGNMPARGGSTYSDEEITLAVQHMAGFEIEEPAADGETAEDGADESGEGSEDSAEAPADESGEGSEDNAEAPADESGEGAEDSAEAPADGQAAEDTADAQGEESGDAAAEGEADTQTAEMAVEEPAADDAAADSGGGGDDVDLVSMIGSGEAPAGMDDTVKSAVDGVCAGCHVAGVAGAPALGDQEAWTPRAESGLAALSATVISGKGAMPPNGGSNLSEDQIPIAVQYLISKQP